MGEIVEAHGLGAQGSHSFKGKTRISPQFVLVSGFFRHPCGNVRNPTVGLFDHDEFDCGAHKSSCDGLGMALLERPDLLLLRRNSAEVKAPGRHPAERHTCAIKKQSTGGNRLLRSLPQSIGITRRDNIPLSCGSMMLMCFRWLSLRQSPHKNYRECPAKLLSILPRVCSNRGPGAEVSDRQRGKNANINNGLYQAS